MYNALTGFALRTNGGHTYWKIMYRQSFWKGLGQPLYIYR